MNKRDIENVRLCYYSEFHYMKSENISLSDVEKHYYCACTILEIAKLCGIDRDLIYDLKKELDWDYEEIMAPERERISRVKKVLEKLRTEAEERKKVY